MTQYRAWRREKGERVQEIEFEAKSLRAAKSKATKDLVVDGGWAESTIFLNGEGVAGWKKRLPGPVGVLRTSLKIEMIEIT